MIEYPTQVTTPFIHIVKSNILSQTLELIAYLITKLRVHIVFTRTLSGEVQSCSCEKHRRM